MRIKSTKHKSSMKKKTTFGIHFIKLIANTRCAPRVYVYEQLRWHSAIPNYNCAAFVFVFFEPRDSFCVIANENNAK